MNIPLDEQIKERADRALRDVALTAEAIDVLLRSDIGTCVGIISLIHKLVAGLEASDRAYAAGKLDKAWVESHLSERERDEMSDDEMTEHLAESSKRLIASAKTVADAAAVSLSVQMPLDQREAYRDSFIEHLKQLRKPS
jgi:hypothetical protein